MNKICTKCGDEKPEKHFHFRNKEKGKRVSRCADCFSSYRKKFYEANKPYYFNLAKQARARKVAAKQLYVVQYLKQNPCVDCGEKDIVVLDFDHIRDTKVDGIANIIHDGKSLEALKTEIKKCKVRCANCHRRRTARERQSYKFGVI